MATPLSKERRLTPACAWSLRFETEQFKNFAKNMKEELWTIYACGGRGGRRFWRQTQPDLAKALDSLVP